jgi:hypothetical protein
VKSVQDIKDLSLPQFYVICKFTNLKDCITLKIINTGLSRMLEQTSDFLHLLIQVEVILSISCELDLIIIIYLSWSWATC